MATSTLNPNAPMFVPLSYRQVEDFSDQWWDLVSSSPWFRDYWLRECFHDEPPLPSDAGTDSFPTPNSKKTTRKQDEWEGGRLDLVSIGFFKWSKQQHGGNGMAEIFAKTTKYGYGGEKSPKKIVNLVRVNPKPIKQPR